MKKFYLSVVVLLMTATNLFAQADVTKFLDIPIDGTKSEMIRKLKAKGFVSSRLDPEILEGEFNGMNVNLHVVTNNNKVYRIMVVDQARVSETDIRIRFNNLCRQFENNSKYTSYGDNTIPEDEDISYEISVHNKRYQAVFYQVPDTSENSPLWNIFVNEFSEEEIENISNVIMNGRSEEELMQLPKEELAATMIEAIISSDDDSILDTLNRALELYMETAENKPVWFKIADYRGRYQLVIYYDNMYNMANGQDL